jgi:bifunctional non-homologous end joining protein LigD
VLRHASFVGLRADKPAADVVAETPALVLAAPAGITNPGRVLFPESDVTKGMLAAYVEAMAPHLLREIGGRPISLVRCPDGRAKACFFQRHAGQGFGGKFGDHVKALTDPHDPADKWLYVDDADGLLACIQMGTIEFHGWGSTVAELERPDRLVFDLDPDESMPFMNIAAAAVELRDQLDALGLPSMPMLSGGKGIHVIVALEPAAEWPQVKDFARRFALAMEQRAPERYTSSMSKARRKGRIFIDWLRNQRGATSVMPWSVRARPRAPVAVPVSWEELPGIASPAQWTLLDIDTLLKRAGREVTSPQRPQTLPDI